jgi:hypothetical protein
MKNKEPELVKNNQLLTNEELNLLRERFVNDYSKKKGWNPKELSTTQMMEIVSQKQYKTPGLLLG